MLATGSRQLANCSLQSIFATESKIQQRHTQTPLEASPLSVFLLIGVTIDVGVARVAKTPPSIESARTLDLFFSRSGKIGIIEME